MAGDDSRDVLDALRHVVDPEVGVNIVDLGLVYAATIRDGHAHVVMTMTTAACPLGGMLADDVRTTIQHRVRGVRSVSVELVQEPRWDPSMMSAAAREHLGWK